MKPPRDAATGWLDGAPHLRGPLARCASGDLPPNVALMQILVEAIDPAEVGQALTQAIDAAREAPESADRLRQALALWHANPRAFATVKSVLKDVEHQGATATPDAGLAHWAGLFDRLARQSPEGSVALYALGNPDLLEAATAEVVAKMREWGLLGPGRAVLEIGCGIGRFERALSTEAGLVVGIDISGEMIEAAKARCAGLANVRLMQSSGRDLALFPDESFDVVLAVDSFPYLVQSGMALVERHLQEAARVLKLGGDLLILNFSYRGDPEADRRDLARLSATAGFREVRSSTRDFEVWDGLTFQFSKAR